jgi:hypothetical protein
MCLAAMNTLVTAGALYNALALEGIGALCARWKMVVLVILLKLVVLPLICFPLTLGAIRWGWLDRSDPLLLLIVFVESAVPSAQSLVGLAQLLLPESETGKLSALYLPMYLTSVLTITVAVAVALWLIEFIIDEDHAS